MCVSMDAAKPVRNRGHHPRKTRALRRNHNRRLRRAAQRLARRRIARKARLRKRLALDRQHPLCRASNLRRRARSQYFATMPIVNSAPSRAASSWPAVTASSDPLLSAAPLSSACVSTRMDSIIPLRSTRRTPAQSRRRSCSSRPASSAAASAGSPKRTANHSRRAPPSSPFAVPA